MISETFENLLFEVKENIGFLTLNRPDKLNALSEEVLKEMSVCLAKISEEHLSGVVFTGAGEKAFIAGADIKAMQGMTVDQASEFCKLGQKVSFQIENLKCPIIAAVNGFALGGGLEMALACDFIYASNNAVFGLPEVSLGLIPGFGGTQRLAKVIGRNYAKEIVFTGDKIDVTRAKDIGLVVRAFNDKESLIEEATNTIKRMQKNSPFAVSKAKKAINNGVDFGNVDGLKMEREIFSALFNSYDMKEGTLAFLEKRKAEFKGN